MNWQRMGSLRHSSDDTRCSTIDNFSIVARVHQVTVHLVDYRSHSSRSDRALRCDVNLRPEEMLGLRCPMEVVNDWQSVMSLEGGLP